LAASLLVALALALAGIGLVLIFDRVLTPAQRRNWIERRSSWPAK
jgi:hypothetical protein